MYLHSLELRAIGPYPDTVRIDFAALAASGVFLLEGPTGSGKSTIIDAVVYALYGGLAGSVSSADRLHSQHAAPGVEPSVELVFETGAGIHRVRRTPQYDRPKQRGTGTVRQQASARLYRLASADDPAGEPLSDRAQEVGDEIARIVGLNRAQFLQTVVLPQGEFARFLQSPGEERRRLLQSLFGTAVYDRTAEELAAMSRSARAAVEAADAKVRAALERFAQASGADDVDESGVDDVLVALDTRAASTTAEHERARARAVAARAAESDARRRAAAVDRRAGLLARQDALAEGAAALERRRAQVELAERAARVVPVVDGAVRARSRADTAAAEAALLRTERTVPGSDVAATALVLRGAVADVRHLIEVERGLAERTTRIAQAEDDLATRSARDDERQAQIDGRPATRAALSASVRAAAERAADADPAQRALAEARERETHRTEWVAAVAEVRAAEQRLVTSRTEADAAVEIESALRRARIAGLAGELGAALRPGDACPVCGAVEHPDVAAPRDDHPTPERIDRAATERVDAESALQQAVTALELARAGADRLAAILDGADQSGIADQVAHAEERVAAARRAADEVVALERRQEAFDRETAALLATQSASVAALASDRATAAAERERLREDRAAVERARDLLDETATGVGVALGGASGASTSWSSDGLAAHIAVVDAVLRDLNAVVEADARARSASTDADDRAAEVQRLLEQQHFTDVDAVRAAVLDESELRAARATVRAADEERAVVTAGLAEPEVLAAADETGPIDLAAVQQATARAEEALDAAAREAAAATGQAVAARGCAVDLRRALDTRAATSASGRAVVRMADVAAGAPSVNPSGITLGTYVLMRRFEDVVAAANDRLRTMLAGRFELQTSDERESGSRARRTGLALAVLDHTTDSTRDPRSLSGGETFTVSLCLALGLADVVQAEAGGVSLGTLFVDEGFGTLDPEALDDVIGQLARLTAGGRQVGIVSHVDELKQRIPERIAVRRAPGGGSRVTTTV